LKSKEGSQTQDHHTSNCSNNTSSDGSSRIGGDGLAINCASRSFLSIVLSVVTDFRSSSLAISTDVAGAVVSSANTTDVINGEGKDVVVITANDAICLVAETARVGQLTFVFSKANSAAILVRVPCVIGTNANIARIQGSSISGLSWANTTFIVSSIGTSGRAVVSAGGGQTARARDREGGAFANHSLGVFSGGELVPSRVISGCEADSTIIHKVIGHIPLIREPTSSASINKGTVRAGDEGVCSFAIGGALGGRGVTGKVSADSTIVFQEIFGGRGGALTAIVNSVDWGINTLAVVDSSTVSETKF